MIPPILITNRVGFFSGRQALERGVEAGSG